MKSAIAAIPFLLMGSSMAAPLEKRACPNIHIFGARETTAPAGYGSAGTVVNLILNAHPGSTAEVINYPAAGGNSYASSVQAGVQAVTNQINSFAASCPNTQLVYVGYSQGAQIGDDALCGGGDPNQGISNTAAPISSAVGSKVKAIIFMGDPRNIPGGPYSVGTAKNPGFDPRPSGFTCSAYASRIQSYCDSADPYCSNGNDANVHQGYGQEYGQAALKFVNSKLT
ncbi:acetylxylan esterase precursor [Aureobasidium sp. EXF-10727]|nr:acetylxylan esterase precursor [Aureobasidium sp. EXF-10727]